MRELNLDSLDPMTCEEIENLRVEKLHELEIESQHTGLVEQEFLIIQRKIIELQLKKKDLEVALSKGKNNIRSAKNQIEMLRSKFWSKKN